MESPLACSFLHSLPYNPQITRHKGREQGNLSNTIRALPACGWGIEAGKKSWMPPALCFQDRLETWHQTSADTCNYIQITDTRSVIDLFLEGRTSYPVRRGVTLLNSEGIITQHKGHSCYCYISGFISESDREQRSSEHFNVRRQAQKLQA